MPCYLLPEKLIDRKTVPAGKNPSTIIFQDKYFFHSKSPLSLNKWKINRSIGKKQKSGLGHSSKHYLLLTDCVTIQVAKATKRTTVKTDAAVAMNAM
jgi:hypothetical protein